MAVGMMLGKVLNTRGTKVNVTMTGGWLRQRRRVATPFFAVGSLGPFARTAEVAIYKLVAVFGSQKSSRYARKGSVTELKAPL